jgi:hypothetical protein
VPPPDCLAALQKKQEERKKKKKEKRRRKKKEEERKKKKKETRRKKKVISISYRFYMPVPCIYLKALPVVFTCGFFHFFFLLFWDCRSPSSSVTGQTR